VGVYWRRGDDSRVCGGIFSVGFGNLCHAFGSFWVGLIGACCGGVGGVFVGVCELLPPFYGTV